MSIPTQLTAAWFQPVFTCSTAAAAAAAAALLLHRRSAAICRAQTDTSWASIKHQLSSPAVLGCQRETESVSPEQPPSPSEHFHYVSLDKLLPPPPLTSSPLLWAAHNLVSSLSDTTRTHSLWEIHLSFTAFHLNHSRQKNQLVTECLLFSFTLRGLIKTNSRTVKYQDCVSDVRQRLYTHNCGGK